MQLFDFLLGKPLSLRRGLTNNKNIPDAPGPRRCISVNVRTHWLDPVHAEQHCGDTTFRYVKSMSRGGSLTNARARSASTNPASTMRGKKGENGQMMLILVILLVRSCRGYRQIVVQQTCWRLPRAASSVKSPIASIFVVTVILTILHLWFLHRWLACGRRQLCSPPISVGMSSSVAASLSWKI